MIRAGSHDSPPFVVRVNHAGPLKPSPTTFSLPCGADTISPRAVSSRSHTAYTKSASFGSAVIAFLSFRKRGSVSSLRMIGAPHLRPPSVERL